MGFFSFGYSKDGLEDRIYRLKHSKIPTNEEWLQDNPGHPEFNYWKQKNEKLKAELEYLESKLERMK